MNSELGGGVTGRGSLKVLLLPWQNEEVTNQDGRHGSACSEHKEQFSYSNGRYFKG